jgi:hypothetical protein
VRVLPMFSTVCGPPRGEDHVAALLWVFGRLLAGGRQAIGATRQEHGDAVGMLVQRRLFAGRDGDPQHTNIGVVDFDLVMGRIDRDGILGKKARRDGETQRNSQERNAMHGASS